jgi:hypothetical protein
VSGPPQLAIRHKASCWPYRYALWSPPVPQTGVNGCAPASMKRQQGRAWEEGSVAGTPLTEKLAKATAPPARERPGHSTRAAPYFKITRQGNDAQFCVLSETAPSFPAILRKRFHGRRSSVRLNPGDVRTCLLLDARGGSHRLVANCTLAQGYLGRPESLPRSAELRREP